MTFKPRPGAEIENRAYEIWERSGRPEGREDEFWQLAEQELRNEDKSSPPPYSRHFVISLLAAIFFEMLLLWIAGFVLHRFTSY
ncbi:DUF2934 domain-containing protein [Bradyrhizobium sp. SRL28]|uniref:DUF2934 domain-containing protein n=1 Tax=Bradyrhizobium sp. SRL28 TaxID=2836178 RepID=UPI0035B1EB02